MVLVNGNALKSSANPEAEQTDDSNGHSSHMMFVEAIEGDIVLLRNSWGHYLETVKLDRWDSLIQAFFRLKLKQLKQRGDGDIIEDRILFDDYGNEMLVLEEWPDAVGYPPAPKTVQQIE